MQENYLAKWLNNELSGEELEAFKKTEEYASYQRIAKASEHMEAPEFNVDKAWNSFKDSQSIGKETKVVQLNPFRQFLRVAAVIAVLLGGAYFYLGSLDQHYSAQLAEQTSVTLPDASEVLLNAESSITFNEKNWDDNRNVTLAGEAFFKVAKGEKFTVSTEAGNVAVLGTQFNVESRDDFFEVTCYEGLVSVSFKGKDIKLPAGNAFVVINGEIQETDKVLVTAPEWTKNESSFKSVPLKYVLAEFERQFSIKVDAKNIDIDQLFTGSFDNTNINLALESISTPSQLRYTLEEEKVLFYVADMP